MNNSLVVSAGSSNFDRTYVNPENGSYQAICVDVLDLGEREKTYKGNTKVVREVKFLFQIDEEITEEALIDAKKDAGKSPELTEKEREFIGKRMLVSSRPFAFSLWETSGLYQFLKAWRDKDFTPAELKGFNLDQMVGVNANLMISNKSVGEKTYANIVDITPLKTTGKKAQTPLGVDGYVRKHIRDAERASAAAGANATVPATTGGDDIPFSDE